MHLGGVYLSKRDQISMSIIKSYTLLERKSKTYHLTFTKADKGNCLVIINKAGYLLKVETFLQEHCFKKLKRNPVTQYKKQLDSVIRTLTPFLEEIDTPRSLLPDNPPTARLYGLPKIHKLGFPIRLVVSFINTLASVVSRVVLNLLTDLTGFAPRYGLKNSLDLVARLQSHNLKPESWFRSMCPICLPQSLWTSQCCW